MDPEDSSSELYILDRLFNRSFSEYWSLFCKDHDFNKYKSVEKELEDAVALFPNVSFINCYDSDHETDQLTYTDEPEFSKRIVEERFRKLRVINELQRSFEVLSIGSESLCLVSRNEEFEEIHTENLKYTLLPYLTAHVIFEKPDLMNRFQILKKVQIYLHEFVNVLERLAIPGVEEPRVSSRGKSENRDFKLREAAQERDLKRAISEAFSTSTSVDDYFHYNRYKHSDREEQYRTTLLNLLKLFSIQCSNHLNSIKMELPFVEQRERNKLVFSKQYDPTGERNLVKPWFLHIDHNTKLDPSLVRTLYRHMVFLPGHNLPTISLDECARIEMEMDVNTIGTKSVSVKKKESGESLIDNLDEQESERSSVCTEDERSWDDWKDDHPKGQGNKDVNVG